MASNGMMPPNIENDGRMAGGMLRIRNVVETVIVIAALYLFSKIFLFAVPTLIKYGIMGFIGLPLVLITLMGIGDISLGEWYMDRKAFKKGQKIYPFKIPTKKEEKRRGIFGRNKNETEEE